MARIGVIGGSGLENPGILELPDSKEAITPYGAPSSPLLAGRYGGSEVVILSRHGKDHTIPPSAVNNRANIWALREAGCTHILSTTACGSLKEEIGRGDIVIPDQFIDFTRRREVTFYERFEPGTMGHTPMADPFDNALRELLISSARKLNLSVHERGTVITIEGPRFSTRAESKLFRLWGADIINMSVAPEVILANELRIPYATVAMSTDYDSWKSGEDPVTWEEVIMVFKKNANNVLRLLQEVISLIK